MSLKEPNYEIEDLEELEVDTPGPLIVTPRSVTPVTTGKRTSGLSLGNELVQNVREILNLDDDENLSTEQKLFLIAYATYGTISQACRVVGVDPRTHKKWMKDEHYAEVFHDAFDIVTDKIEETSLIASLIPENVKERMFHLSSRRPETYGRKDKVNVSGEVKHTHTLADIAREAYKSGALEEDE